MLGSESFGHKKHGIFNEQAIKKGNLLTQVNFLC